MDKTMKEAWVEMPTEEALRAERPSAQYNPYDFGFLMGMERLLLTHGRIGRAFIGLINEVMFKRGHLSRTEREMLAVVTAGAQDCHY